MIKRVLIFLASVAGLAAGIYLASSAFGSEGITHNYQVAQLTATAEYSPHYYVLKGSNNPMRVLTGQGDWIVAAGPFHHQGAAETAMWFLINNPDAPRFTRVPIIGTNPDVELP